MTRKHLTTIVLLFCSLSLLAQQNWQLGFSSSTLFSYRHLTLHQEKNQVKEIRDGIESPLLGYSFALQIRKNISPRFSLQSGLSVQNFGYKMSNLFIFSDDGTEYEASLRLRHTTLAIPVVVGYRLALGETNKHSLLFQAGCNNHFTLSVNRVLVSNEYSSKHHSDLSKYYHTYSISAFGSINYLYQYNRHGIQASLLFDYGLIPINKQTSVVSQRMYYGGIGIGYFYSFG